MFRRALIPVSTWLFRARSRETLVGYLISYPWRSGSAPPLNSLIHHVPSDADVLYLHDLALRPDARGCGCTAPMIDWLVMEAGRDGWSSIALVAVNHAAEFWKRSHFRLVDDPGMTAKLKTYGEGAIYMVRAAGDRSKAH